MSDQLCKKASARFVYIRHICLGHTSNLCCVFFCNFTGSRVPSGHQSLTLANSVEQVSPSRSSLHYFRRQPRSHHHVHYLAAAVNKVETIRFSGVPLIQAVCHSYQRCAARVGVDRGGSILPHHCRRQTSILKNQSNMVNEHTGSSLDKLLELRQRRVALITETYLQWSLHRIVAYGRRLQ